MQHALSNVWIMHVKSSVALTHLFQNFKLRKSRWHYVSNAWEGGKIWSLSHIHDIYILHILDIVYMLYFENVSYMFYYITPSKNVWDGGGAGLSLIIHMIYI